MNIVGTARALYHFVRLTRDPSRLGAVFKVVETLQTPEILGEIERALAVDPGVDRALDERPRVGRVDLPRLRSLPEGTFGRAFADHLDKNGLDPNALPVPPASTRWEFINAHLYETHDIWHAVTGFGADVAGELGLQAFYLAQFPARLGSVLLAVGFLNAFLFEFDDQNRRLDEITRGWLLGKRARSLFGVRWNDLWDKPLAEVRASLNLDQASVNAAVAAGPSGRPRPIAAAA